MTNQQLFPGHYQRIRTKRPFSVWRLVTTPARWLHRFAQVLAPWLGILFFIVPGRRNRNALGYAYAWFLIVFFVAAIVASFVVSVGSAH
ncbi:hypothetical protein [Kocuria massiliensis]|uniref:hypothetical protein n=1 Tax=Kocuria massiliensis TaxID=1926282 RepID=UPI000AE2BB78|nr:hypothetical protein [Kocuria massiliensis]